MAVRLPRPLERREILYGQSTPRDRLLELAEAYLAKGLLFDAVEFYAAAKDREGLAKIKAIAIKEGDAFLLRRVHETMPSEVSSADWQALEASARALGKELYAERASKGGTPPPPPLQEEAKLGEEPPETQEAPQKDRGGHTPARRGEKPKKSAR